MANISDANGTLTLINGKNLSTKEVEDVLSLIHVRLSTIEYGTFLTHAGHDDITNEEVQSCINNDYTINFVGVGRWSYAENASSMFETMISDDPNASKIYEMLLDKNVQLKFDFIEYEPGCEPDRLPKYTIIVEPKKTVISYGTNVIECHQSFEPMKAKTMLDNGFIMDYLTLDDIQNKSEKALEYFETYELDELLDEFGEEFEDADGTINVFAIQDDGIEIEDGIFIPEQ